MGFMRAVLSLALMQIASASVIGIDFGSNYMKVALVQLKVPLEIVPNTISKRKTEVAVAFDRGERLYGSDAEGMLSRKPGMAYAHFREMIGRSKGHPSVEAVEDMRYGTSPFQNETRGGLDYRYKGDKNIEGFSAEELAAMVYSYARDITKDFGGQSVRDCVITVPSFATALERRAMINAAEIAGLKVLSLIEENTAAALQWGKDRVEDNNVVLYYNMGTTSTQVTITRYFNYTTKEAGKNKTVGMFEVLAKSWDETLGGERFDKMIMEHMADEFTKTGSDPRSSHKTMSKLRAQATKTKHVLSANSEIPVKINSLMDDKDYVTHMTRAQLEEMAKPLLDRLVPPVQRALDFANLTLADINAVEMIGGGQRVPSVLSTLSAYFGESLPLGVHLNADESPALGAAFEAANISTMFKVRKTGMIDHSPWPVQISLKSIPKPTDDGSLLGGLFASKPTAEEVAAGVESDNWEKSTTLFKPWSKLDSKKLIAFHHDRDIMCEVSYVTDAAAAAEGGGGEKAMPLPQGTNSLIAQFNITGVHKFIKGMSEKGFKTCGLDGSTKPKMTLHFKLDSSGIVRLNKAEATCEQPVIQDKKDEDKEEEKKADSDSGDNDEEEGEASATGEDEDNSESSSPEGDDGSENDSDDTKKEGEEDSSATDKKDEKEMTKEEKKAAKKAAKKEAKKKEEEKKKKDKKNKEKKDQLFKLELAVDEDFSSPVMKSLHPDAVEASKNKLAYLQELDDERKFKLESKNALESYLYSVKNRMEDDAEVIETVSTEEQREELNEKVRSEIDWLDDDGFDAKGVVYNERKLVVSDMAEPIFFRAEESTARPEAVGMARKRLSDIRLLVEKWIETMPQVTDAERADVIEKVEKAEVWLDEKVALQLNTPAHEKPAFTSAEVTQSLKATANLVTRLSRKPKPKPKAVVNITNATAGTNATTETVETVDETAAPGGEEDSTDKSSGEESAEKSDNDEL